ncbi:MAG TPA: VC0807 family protein, partial [Desertimonas sp.]|nr:VC0807 family protein [Desertimonas sp.]
AFGATTAMLAVLVWGYATILRRALTGRAIPSLLVLAMCGLTVKTLVGVVSGSTFAYFLQPIATTVAIGAVFFGSVLVGRPVIARIAHDFCPISPEVASRPSVVRLFAGLTVLWATVQLINAGATLGMLFSLPTTLYVVLKPATSLLISAAAVTVTVCWALRTAHREELVFARA